MQYGQMDYKDIKRQLSGKLVLHLYDTNINFLNAQQNNENPTLSTRPVSILIIL